VSFQVLTATSLKMAVFWDVARYCVVNNDRCSEERIASIIRTMIALLMEAVGSSETSVNIYQTTRYNIPGDSHLRFHFGAY
jgi:hypothetical protein